MEVTLDWQDETNPDRDLSVIETFTVFVPNLTSLEVTLDWQDQTNPDRDWSVIQTSLYCSKLELLGGHMGLAS